MSETAERPQTASEQVDAWLAAFNDALERGDAEAAAALFRADSYWRDLVAFTWNIKTMEGPDGRRATAREPLADDRSRAASPRPSDAGRGGRRHRGLDRVRDRGRPRLGPHAAAGRRGLDAAHHDDELKGYEEPSGPARPMGAEHGANQGRKTWKEQREERGRRARLRRRSPTCSSSAAARAASRSARGCASSACRRSSSTSTRGPATPGASATSRSACTTRSGTTTCPTSSSRTTGRSSRRRTRSATGWRCTPR